MNYKDKYLKYKLKYLNIKSFIGGSFSERQKNRSDSPGRSSSPLTDKEYKSRKKDRDHRDPPPKPPTLEQVELKDKQYNIVDSIHIINQALLDLKNLETIKTELSIPKNEYEKEVKNLQDTIIEEKIKINEIKKNRLISAKKSITKIVNLKDIIENEPNKIFNNSKLKYDWKTVQNIREFFRSVLNVSKYEINFLARGGNKTVYRANIGEESINSLKGFIQKIIPHIRIPPEKYVVSILQKKRDDEEFRKDITHFHNVLSFLDNMNLNPTYIHLPYFFIKDIDETYYTIEEHIEDGDLFTIMNEELKYYEEKNQRLKIILNLLKCLDQLHSNNYCHLDIKPENFLVKKNPDDPDNSLQIKLTDFDFMEEFELIPLTDLKGSPQYIDPNVMHIRKRFYSGDKSEFNDLYGIGIIYYILCNRREPYKNKYYHEWVGLETSKETANNLKTPEEKDAEKKATEALVTVQNKKKQIEAMIDRDEKNAKLSAVMMEEATALAELEDYLYKDGFYLDVEDNFERKFISYLCNPDLSKRFKTKDLIAIMEVEIKNQGILLQKAKRQLDFKV